MTYDPEICKAILTQFNATSTYETTDANVGFHIGFLEDRKQVECKWKYSKAGDFQSVRILRMTELGYAAFQCINEGGYFPSGEEREERVRARQDQSDCEEGFRKLLATIAAGGIGVIFTLVSAVGFKVNNQDVKGLPEDCGKFLIGALVAWGGALLLVLISTLVSGWSYDKYVSEIDEGNMETGWNNCWGRLAQGLLLLGAIAVLCGIVPISIVLWKAIPH